MEDYRDFDRELDRLEQGKSKYVWDELEELITDRFDDGKLTSQEYDTLMHRLMDIDCEL